MPTPVAVTRASRENARPPPVSLGAPASPVCPARVAAATTVTSAIKSRAVTKWAVTHQGSSSVATTTAPSPA